jgi:MYXO-CTERM domain-containing protein
MSDGDRVEAEEGVDAPAIATMVASVALLAAAGAAWIWRRARRRPPSA